MTNEHWKVEPESHDFPSAQRYLSLLVEPQRAKRLARALKHGSKIEYFIATDILRSSGLPLLAADDKEVAKDLAKVAAGDRLSPVLLVRGSPLWVADGYHRVCASYHIDENAEIPSRIVTRLSDAR